MKDRSFGLVDYVEKMAQSRVPGAGWGQSWFGGFFFVCLFISLFSNFLLPKFIKHGTP